MHPLAWYAAAAVIFAVALYYMDYIFYCFTWWYIKNVPTFSFLNIFHGVLEIKAGGFGGKSVQQICAALSNNFSDEFWDETSPAKCDKFIMSKAMIVKNTVYHVIFVFIIFLIAVLCVTPPALFTPACPRLVSHINRTHAHTQHACAHAGKRC